MKKVRRKIIVAQCQYVYWYQLNSDSTVIYISPIDDKTNKIGFVFENNTDIAHEGSAWFWRLTIIIAKKENEKIEINILRPRFIASLIKVAIKENPSLFKEKNAEMLFANAYLFLERMGYTSIRPLWEVSLW